MSSLRISLSSTKIMFATNVLLVRTLCCCCCWPVNHNWLHFVKYSIISCWIWNPGTCQLIGASRLHQITSQSTWIVRIFREGKSPDPSSMLQYCISPQYAPPRFTNKKCLGMPLTFDDLCHKTNPESSDIHSLPHTVLVQTTRHHFKFTLTYIFSFPFTVWKSNRSGVTLTTSSVLKQKNHS